MTPLPPTDPETLARRRRIESAAATGKRLGYGFILMACVVFAAGLVWKVQPWMAPVTAVAFALSAVCLVPATIAAYGVKAADREDAELATAAAEGHSSRVTGR